MSSLATPVMSNITAAESVCWTSLRGKYMFTAIVHIHLNAVTEHTGLVTFIGSNTCESNVGIVAVHFTSCLVLHASCSNDATYRLCTDVQAKVVQSSADLTQLANIYIPAVLKHTPGGGPLLLAGVGMCTMLARELSLLLPQHRCQVKLLIAAESIPVSLAKQAVDNVHSSASVSGEMLQTWCAMHQLIAATARPPPFSQPSITEVIRKLRSLHSYEQQLDYISTFCPAGKTALQWDTEVDAVLARVLHMRQLLLAYQPNGNTGHSTLVLRCESKAEARGRLDTADVQQVADDSWETIAHALLPASACSIAAGTSGPRSAEVVESLLCSML